MKKSEVLIQRVKELISCNKTRKALELLAKEQLASLDKDLIILNSRYSKVEEDLRLEVIDYDLAQRRINTINRDLLDLSEKIKEHLDNKITYTTPLKNGDPSTLKNKKAFNKWLIIVPVFSAIVVFGIYMLIPDNSDSTMVQADFKWECINSTCEAPCEIQFTNSSYNANKFIWDFGDGHTSTLLSPRHNFQEDKTYRVKLTAIGKNTNDEKIETIQINPSKIVEKLPIANFSSDKSECDAPCKITFKNLSSHATQYKWEVNGVQVSIKRDLKYTFKSHGKYSINLIANNGSKQNNYQKYIQIKKTKNFTSNSVQERLDRGESPFKIISNGIPLDSLYGKLFEGGLIFFIDRLNKNGLVAAPSDQQYNGNVKLTWGKGCMGKDLLTPNVKNHTQSHGGIEIGAGTSNTKAIVNADCIHASDAAFVCNNLDLNGYTDWFLPSLNELEAMYLRIGQMAPNPNMNIGRFVNSPYYSSSESHNLKFAWFLEFANGNKDDGNKNNKMNVRAVRKFSN